MATDTVLPEVIVTADRPVLDRRERRNDHEEALRMALDGLQARIQTALPGIVRGFDPNSVTASVQPAIQARVMSDNGQWDVIPLPVLHDVPVQFPGGGGFSLTFPVSAGDECLIVFASRCIDAWWQHGEVQPQAEHRMHDLSDAFALVGVRSQVRPYAGGIYAGGVELRSDDGAQHIHASGGGWHILGNVTVQGDVVADGVSLKTHTHGNTQPGEGSTGTPNV